MSKIQLTAASLMTGAALVIALGAPTVDTAGPSIQSTASVALVTSAHDVALAGGKGDNAYKNAFRKGYRKGFRDGARTARQTCRQERGFLSRLQSESAGSRGFADGYDRGFSAGFRAVSDRFC